jgi:hypothetical protein
MWWVVSGAGALVTMNGFQNLVEFIEIWQIQLVFIEKYIKFGFGNFGASRIFWRLLWAHITLQDWSDESKKLVERLT